jgi:hypothetical protein
MAKIDMVTSSSATIINVNEHSLRNKMIEEFGIYNNQAYGEAR